jgi:hypothetical protein
MKSIPRTALYMLFSLALLGPAFAQHVQTDFDHRANFSQYKTYLWQVIKPANSLWDGELRTRSMPNCLPRLGSGQQRWRRGHGSDQDNTDSENASHVL